MGLSLGEAAVRGTKSVQTIADQKQTLLAAGDVEGLLALNHSLFGGATMMAEKDDDADDAEDDEDDESEDDEDDSDDEEDDKKGKKPDPRDVRIEELSREAKKRRLRAKQLREENEALKAQLAQKGKPKKGKDDEDEDDEESTESEEAKALKRENEQLKERLQSQTIRQGFNDLLDDPKSKIKFKDRKAAFRLLDRDEIEIDEDGEVEGLEDAIKDLAKAYPFLVDDGKSGDEDEDDEDEKPQRRRQTGQRSGGRRKGTKPNTEALAKKYGIKR